MKEPTYYKLDGTEGVPLSAAPLEWIRNAANGYASHGITPIQPTEFDPDGKFRRLYASILLKERGA